MALQLRTSCPHCMSLLSHADCDCAKRGVVGVAGEVSMVGVAERHGGRDKRGQCGGFGREAWWAWQEFCGVMEHGVCVVWDSGVVCV